MNRALRCALLGLLGSVLAPAGLRAAEAPASCEPPDSTWAEVLGFPSDKKVLILHADDAGMFQGANAAIQDLLADGNIQSASAMPPTKYFDEFRSWWQSHSKFDVGIHLTLNSEWKKPFALRWGSISPAAWVRDLLVDYDSDITLKKDHVDTWWANAPEQVRDEIVAQCIEGSTQGLRPSHFDSHMGTVWVRGSYYRHYLALARKSGIPAVTVRTRKKNVHFSGKSILEPKGVLERIVAYFLLRKVRKVQQRDEEQNGWCLPRLDYYCRVPTNEDSYEDFKNGFKTFVKEKLPPGVTQFFVHPNREDDPDLKHSTNKWMQRVWDEDLFKDEDIQQFFEEEDIYFTNWRNIMCRWNGMGDGCLPPEPDGCP